MCECVGRDIGKIGRECVRESGCGKLWVRDTGFIRMDKKKSSKMSDDVIQPNEESICSIRLIWRYTRGKDDGMGSWKR